MRMLFCRIILLLLPVVAAAAPAVVRLKPTASVSGEVIKVADVAEVMGGEGTRLREIEVGNSPWPGCTAVVDKDTLALRLASAGVDLASVRLEGRVCRVRRAGVRIRGRDIAEAAVRALKEGTGKGVNLQVTVLSVPHDVFVPEGKGKVDLVAALPAGAVPSGVTGVRVNVVRNGRRLAVRTVTVEVHVFMDVVVASRGISRGETLGVVNLTRAKRMVDRLYTSVFTDVGALSGKVAACNIPFGTVITRRMVAEPERPLVIEYNQRVQVVLETPVLRVVTVGRALGRGRVGDIITVENISSRKKITGRVMADGTVRVSMGVGR